MGSWAGHAPGTEGRLRAMPVLDGLPRPSKRACHMGPWGEAGTWGRVQPQDPKQSMASDTPDTRALVAGPWPLREGLCELISVLPGNPMEQGQHRAGLRGTPDAREPLCPGGVTVALSS